MLIQIVCKPTNMTYIIHLSELVDSIDMSNGKCVLNGGRFKWKDIQRLKQLKNLVRQKLLYPDDDL